MAIGLAFVDIVGDTERTGPQIERSMTRVLAAVEEDLPPVDIQAAVDAGTERDLSRQLAADIRAVQAAARSIQLDARLDPDARQRLEASLRTATQQLRSRQSELQVRVDNRPIVEDTVEAVVEAVQVAEAVAPPIVLETRVDSDPVKRDFSAIGKAAAAAVGPIAGIAKSLLSLGAAVPAAAGVAAAVQAMAPAAALAAPAILTVASAIGTIKLATAGVGDAVKAAFDPSDPKAYAEALKKLSPEARKFVGVLKESQPALKALQQEVQNTVFKGLSGDLKILASSLLPQVQGALKATAGSFNDMAHGVFDSATALSKNGTLGKALDSASKSLGNLTQLPAIAVTAFGQLAAAAGPAFEAVTAKLGGGAEKLSGRLSKAFQSGALQEAIQQAVSLVGQLFTVIKNVGSIVGSVFGAANASGANFLQTLGKLTGAMADVFASPAVQGGLKALFDTVSLLATTAAPLLGSALQVVGSTLQALAPGVQTLVKALGDALRPVIAALGPLLSAAAGAVSSLFVALSPLLPLVGQIIAAVGGVLTPILTALGQVFQNAAPLIAALSAAIGSLLLPILAQVPVLLQPLLDGFVRMTGTLFPVALQLVQAIFPAVQQLAASFVEVATALAPVIAQLVELYFDALRPLLPLLPPIIQFVAKLADVFANVLAQQIRNTVIPAIELVSALLRGDASDAISSFKELVKGALKNIVLFFVELPVEIVRALGSLATSLFNIGNQIMLSLINGIKSKIGDLKGVFSNITKMIPDWKGPMTLDRRLLTPSGQAIMDGLIAGVVSRTGALQSTLGDVTGMFAGMAPALPGVTAGTGMTVPASSARGAGSISGVTSGTAAAPMVQVFVGTQQITDIVDVRLAQQNRAQSRRAMTGVRS